MTMRGLIQPPSLPFQPVEVYVNEKKIADWQVGNTASFSAQIPAELTKKSETLNLEFRLSKATSPNSLGLNNDNRTLGVAAYSIQISR